MHGIEGAAEQRERRGGVGRFGHAASVGAAAAQAPQKSAKSDALTLSILPPMSIALAYSQWSASYDGDRNLTRDLDAEVTPQVLPPAITLGLMIEAGCGTGKNTPFFAARSQQVLALDFSSGMLAQAGTRLTQLGVSNVTLRKADLLTTWPAATASADLVSCNLVLEHIQDLRPVFSEAARVLRAGGRFLISELHPFKQYRGSQARFVAEGGETIAIAAFRHHVSDFTRTALDTGFAIERLDEWWHDEDVDQPPRLLTLLLRRVA